MKDKNKPNVIREIEYLYEWVTDRADGQLPDEWRSYRILKKTKCFVFVEYSIGIWHKTMKLDRTKLETKGEIYWHHGTWVICFYTEDGKKRFDVERQRYQYVPECLKALGLTRDATAKDVRRAYFEASQKTHPDTGGDTESFLELQANYQAALKVVKSKYSS